MVVTCRKSTRGKKMLPAHAKNVRTAHAPCVCFSLRVTVQNSHPTTTLTRIHIHQPFKPARMDNRLVPALPFSLCFLP